MPTILANRLLDALTRHGLGALERLLYSQPEAPAVYAHLSRQLHAVDVAEDPLFQFQFRHYYRLDRREASPELIRRYFALLEQYKGGAAVSVNPYAVLRHLVTELSEEAEPVPGWHISMATRLLNCITPVLPVYNANLLAVCALSRGEGLPADARLNLALSHYRRLVPALAWAGADAAVRPLLWQFDEAFPGNVLPTAKKITLLLCDTGKIYVRAEQEARHSAAAAILPAESETNP